MIKVILCDDHALIRKGLRQMIEAEPGFAVTGEAANGAEALALIVGQPPQIAILDVNMPEMGGFDVVREIQKRKLDVALMGFPGDHNRWHPYAGAGFTLQATADANGKPPFNSVDDLAFTQALIQQDKVSFSPYGIVGAQYRFTGMSVFGQATFNPTQHNFLLYNGQAFNFSLEFGVRYNVGSSIDRN